MKKTIRALLNLPRKFKILIFFAIDYLSLIFILISSYLLRIGSTVLENQEILTLIFLPIFAIPILYSLGFYTQILRFISFKILWLIFKASTFYTLLISFILTILNLDDFPRSVLIMNWALTIVIISSIRIFSQFILSNSARRILAESVLKKNILIYGAGIAGVQLSNALKYASDTKIVGFIDDNPALRGLKIHGVEVYSPNSIASLVNKKNINEILLAIPSAKRTTIRKIIKNLKSSQIKIKTVPGIYELTKGSSEISDLKEINIKDLLGRFSSIGKTETIDHIIKNKSVLVTGAGGSIGSELCKQIIEMQPKKLILFDVSEYAMYKISQFLALNGYSKKIVSTIGNVLDYAHVNYVIKNNKVDTIFHAAAYKHVPLMEFNIVKGMENNVFGTKNCAEAAIANNVESFILISTDKAVRPTNYMGASKRLTEIISQNLSVKSSTNFSIVRFGNVLGSSGSVIPLFEKQIQDGGPVTVTHKDIVRYFMTIEEAAQLVIHSGSMKDNGSIFVLDMGEPVKIDDLARKMIKLKGLSVKDKNNPYGDIQIKYSGLRPGEKLYEELLIDGNILKTTNKYIFKLNDKIPLNSVQIKEILFDLKSAIEKNDQEAVKRIIKNSLDEFSGLN